MVDLLDCDGLAAFAGMTRYTSTSIYPKHTEPNSMHFFLSYSSTAPSEIAGWRASPSWSVGRWRCLSLRYRMPGSFSRTLRSPARQLRRQSHGGVMRGRENSGNECRNIVVQVREARKTVMHRRTGTVPKDVLHYHMVYKT